DGRSLAKASTPGCRVFVLNTRAGVIVSRRDREGRPTVFDDLPTLRTGRWISVGRLDISTTGLLLFTNDGGLAHALSHPSTGIDREYAVRVAGLLDDEALARLTKGVDVNGRVESFSDIRYYDGSGTNHWYHVVLMEGRNHEVRDLFASQGAVVSRLKRVRYGPVALPAWLPRGAWEEMGYHDVAALRSILGMSEERPPRKPSPSRSMLIPYPNLT
ncbi:MAG: pseudouridine synthase, partial [Gammaproteobacteria bacterium]|nr:pseudouridine synthase [Gammaproteobacteria bacterium]